MGVFSRFSDIINSNINAILDKAENPEKIIRMAIQEMEDTLVEVRSFAARVIADRKDLDRQLKKFQTAENDWERKAELAISKGREDLARGALIEKNKVIDIISQMLDDKTRLLNTLARHEDDVIKLETKLREARVKKLAIDARHKTALGQVKVRQNLYDNRVRDAFERFDRVEARVDRLEGEAESLALGQINGDDAHSLLSEINTLAQDTVIESELKALKEKLNKGKEAGEEAPQKEKTDASTRPLKRSGNKSSDPE